MSTLSSQSTSTPSVPSAQTLPLRSGEGESWLGLPIAAWVKIGVLGLLMLALYWVNLSRLWAKTNPFTGQGNWEHAIVIPLIGIYYLYVWRDQLLGIAKTDDDADRWSLPGIWGLLLGVPVLLAMSAAPLLLAGGLGASPVEMLAGLADGGLGRLIPVTLGVLAVAAALAGFVYVKRQELLYPATQAWLNNVWHGLGAWLSAMIVLWGVTFFVAVLMPGTPAVVNGVCYTVAAIGVLGLAHVAFRSGSKVWRARYDAVLSSSSVWLGAFIMLWGILFSFWGIWPGQNDFFKDVGMVVALFGVVTLVAGWRVMSVAWFPIVFLFCAIPWPDQVYSWVAMPLQNFAAKIGVFTLKLTGVDASQFGTKIVMVGDGGMVRTLNVAEACAGLKSLMTFVSIAAAVAFLSNRLLWQKVTIALSAIPIAILCNASRVAGQGLLDYYVSREWSENFAHAFAGMVMLIPGFFLILLVCWVLDHLFVEEADDKTVVRRSAAAVPAGMQPVASASPAPAGTATTAAVAMPATAPAAAKRVITIPKKNPQTPQPAAKAPAAVPASAPAKPIARPAGQAPVAPNGVRPAARPVTQQPVQQAMKPTAAQSPSKDLVNQPATNAAAPRSQVAKVQTGPVAPATSAAAKPAGASAKTPGAAAQTAGVAGAARPAARPAAAKPVARPATAPNASTAKPEEGK